MTTHRHCKVVHTDHMTTHRHCVVGAGGLDAGEIPEVTELTVTAWVWSIDLVESHEHCQRSSEFNTSALEVSYGLLYREKNETV